jgi:DNA-binding transcriptional LysR family regulator
MISPASIVEGSPNEGVRPTQTCVKCNLCNIILLDQQLEFVVLDEMRTFVVLAESGSLQRAAERLFLTPSAVTRQIQRLETALKTPLLDRRVKPGRITREGRAVLDRGRQMLRIMDDLKASGAKDAEPSGIFRVGLSYMLAQPSLVASIQRLTSRFPGLQPVLSTHLRQQLIEQLRTGELDVALAFLSADDAIPGDLASSVLAAERLILVKAREPKPGARRSSKSKDHPLNGRWVLNASGCFIRASIEARLRELGSPFELAAAINNIEMQLSLVASGIGFGAIPSRFLASHPRRRRLERITRSGISIEASIVFTQASHLGRLEPAAAFLQQEFRDHFAPVRGAVP